jgi:hypothetical protein
LTNPRCGSYHRLAMQISARILMLLLLLGGGDPLGLLFAPAAVTSATEEDDNVETTKAVVQIERIEHHRPRVVQPISFSASAERSRAKASGIRPAASTAFLAAINSPLNC